MRAQFFRKLQKKKGPLFSPYTFYYYYKKKAKEHMNVSKKKKKTQNKNHSFKINLKIRGKKLWGGKRTPH